jgi:hypothetical protein
MEGESYVWHLNSDWDRRFSWVVIGLKKKSGQLLFLDPYHHDLVPTRKVIASAIRFAKDHDWKPNVRAKPMRIAFDGKGFVSVAEDWKPGGIISALKVTKI